MFAALVIVTVALVATIVGLGSLLRSVQRAAARREDLLVNQILHLSGRTWTPPPADEWRAPRDDEPLVRVWTASPEQQPI